MPPQLGAQSMSEKIMPSDWSQRGERGIQQVVRAGPDVEKDERPEMNDRQPVGLYTGRLRRFRQEVIHDAEDRRGEEEGDGVVPVPPLHQRILHAAEDG